MRRVRSWYRMSILKSAKSYIDFALIGRLVHFSYSSYFVSWPPSLHVSSDPWLGLGASQDSLVCDEFAPDRQRRLFRCESLAFTLGQPIRRESCRSLPDQHELPRALSTFLWQLDICENKPWVCLKAHDESPGFLKDYSDINFYSMAYTELPQSHAPANANSQRIDCHSFYNIYSNQSRSPKSSRFPSEIHNLLLSVLVPPVRQS